MVDKLNLEIIELRLQMQEYQTRVTILNEEITTTAINSRTEGLSSLQSELDSVITKNMEQAKEIQMLKVELASKRTQHTENTSFSSDAKQQLQLLQDQVDSKHKQYTMCKQ